MEVDELDANTNDSSLSNSRSEYPPIIEWGLDPLYSVISLINMIGIVSNRDLSRATENYLFIRFIQISRHL